MTATGLSRFRIRRSARSTQAYSPSVSEPSNRLDQPLPQRARVVVVGACVLPSDGQLDPAQLTYALAAGARAGGVRIATRTRVLAVDTRPMPGAAGRHGARRVTGVRTDRGDVECEIVVDCGG